MKKKLLVVVFICLIGSLALVRCGEHHKVNEAETAQPVKVSFAGFDSEVKWGEHLVTVSACHDCHSPKKIGARGLELDSSRLLSGYDTRQGVPQVNRKELEQKGLTATGDLTSWVGPWGISYTANITSDASGIGSWKEDQFIYALRMGKYKGLAGNRDLLPPMPWQMYQHMTDGELKAIFAYLKSTRPIKNIVPAPLPPAVAAR